MNRIAGFLLAICLGAATHCNAVENPDSPRLQAARRLVSTLELPLIFVSLTKSSLRNRAERDPSRAKEIDWLLAQITVDEATERIAPVYAEYLTAHQADDLHRFFSVEPGKKYWRAISVAMIAGKAFSPPLLTTQEDREIKRFNTINDAWRKLSNSQQMINAKILAITETWMQEIAQRSIDEAGREMADAVDPQHAAPITKGDAAMFASPFAGFFVLIRDYNARNEKSSFEFLARIKEIGLGTLLRPANLISREGIAEGLSKIDRYEAAVSRYWRDYGQATDEFVNAMKEVPVANEVREGFMAGAEKGMASSYERAIRMEESQRAFISLTRQILALADDRFGKIKLEDNVLIFDETADLNAYEGLRQRLKNEAQVQNKLEEEDQQARQAALRTLRAEKVPQPSATRTDSPQVAEAASATQSPRTETSSSKEDVTQTNTDSIEKEVESIPSATSLNALFPAPMPQCAQDATRRKSVRARHVVVEPADWKARTRASLSDWKAAYSKAIEARQALVGGTQTFAILHEKLSKNAASRGLPGGDLGFFARGVMVPQIERMAFCLPVGELSPIVRSDFGFHVIQVMSVKY